MSHTIKQQQLQLTIPQEHDSWDLQGSFRQIYYQQVVDRLESVCDEIGVDLNIDSLEIDTGLIERKEINEKWADQIEESFRKQLNNLVQNRTTQQKTPVKSSQKEFQHSEMEMIVHFLKTGLLPWWSNKFQPVSIDTILSERIKNQSQEVCSVLTEIFSNISVIKRFVHQFSNNSYEKVIGLFITINKGVTIGKETYEVFKLIFEDANEQLSEKTSSESIKVAFILSFVEAHKKGSSPSAQIVQLFSQLTVTKSVQGKQDFQQAMKQVIKKPKYKDQLGELPYDQWMKSIGALLESASDRDLKSTRTEKSISEHDNEGQKFEKKSLEEQSDEEKNIDGIIQSEDSDYLKEAKRGSEETADKEGDQQPAEQQSSYDETQQLKVQDQQAKDWNDTESQHSETNTVEENKSEKDSAISSNDSDSKKGLRENREQFPIESKGEKTKKETAITDSNTSESVDSEAINSFDHKKGKEDIDETSTSLEFTAEGGKKDDIVIDSNKTKEREQLFSETEIPEENYIDNAGLVLLWPYFSRFFNNLKLFDKGTFKSDNERKKAVIILQYLISPEPDLHEYYLLLNKILCGLPLGDTLMKDALSKEDLDSCNEFLLAVIQNWAALKNTSVSGLQETFLKRNGKLTKKGDKWLLQVERKPFDILLDKLPWQISIVKLSWMDKPIYVEW